jgi:hypothetical protein
MNVSIVACEPECPNTAIYEGADDWRYKDGTKLKGKVILPDGTEVDSDELKLISDEVLLHCTRKMYRM